MRIPFNDGYWITVVEGRNSKFAEMHIYNGVGGEALATWYCNIGELMILNPDESKHNTGDLRQTNVVSIEDAISRMPREPGETFFKFIREGNEFLFKGELYTKKDIKLSDDDVYNCVYKKELKRLGDDYYVFPYPMPSYSQSDPRVLHDGQGYCGSEECIGCRQHVADNL